jgi:hypothetical protein
MYFMLIALVVLGYALEGFRILGTGMPINEATWSPVGYFLAEVIGKFGMSDETLATWFRWTWMIHMVNTMVFVATIPYSKFLHFFYSSICLTCYSSNERSRS